MDATCGMHAAGNCESSCRRIIQLRTGEWARDAVKASPYQNHAIVQLRCCVVVPRSVQVARDCKVPVAGLYSSALASVTGPEPIPPATKTIPLLSSVAVWPYRAVFRLPVTVNVPVAGLYSSELESSLFPSCTARASCNQNHSVVQQRCRLAVTSNIQTPVAENVPVTGL